jgi:ABC-type transport system involved in multi-copper enzyme maturation permease subunit
MLFTLVLKEFRENLLSVRFAATAVVLITLAGVSVISLTSEHRRRIDDYNRRVELHRAEALVGDYSEAITVDRPVPALASLFKGIGTTLTDQVSLKNSAPARPIETVDIESTEALFPVIDLGFLTGVVLSLVALLFSYDAITGEKERGTLRQMLSNSVSRSVIIFSKWLSTFATLAVAVIITLGFGVLLAASLPRSPFSLRGEDYLALASITLAAMLYLSVFALMGILVSSMVSRSASSLAILMLVWVMLIFVFPNAAPYLAVWFSPAPTRQQSIREEKQLGSGLIQELKTRHEKGARRVLNEKLSGKEMQKLVDGIDDEWATENKQAIDRLREDNLSRLRQQEQTGARIAILSPYGAASYAFAALSDSGQAADEKFFQLVRLFDQDQFTPYAKSFAAAPLDNKPAPPVFEYRPASVADRLANASSEMMVLVTYNLVLFLGCFLAFRHYDLR